MSYLRKFTAALAVLFLLGTLVAGSAGATELMALWLNITNKTFEGTGAEGSLGVEGNPFTINCKKVKVTGEVGGNNTETFTALFEFKECNAKSLGDAAGVILFKAQGLLCLLSATALEVGLFIETPADVHLEEIPIIGLVTFLKGSSQVASITPDGVLARTFTAKVETSGVGVQKVKECKDLEVTLKPSIKVLQTEAGAEKNGAISQTVTLNPTTAAEEWKIDG